MNWLTDTDEVSLGARGTWLPVKSRGPLIMPPVDIGSSMPNKPSGISSKPPGQKYKPVVSSKPSPLV